MYGVYLCEFRCVFVFVQDVRDVILLKDAIYFVLPLNFVLVSSWTSLVLAITLPIANVLITLPLFTLSLSHSLALALWVHFVHFPNLFGGKHNRKLQLFPQYFYGCDSLCFRSNLKLCFTLFCKNKLTNSFCSYLCCLSLYFTLKFSFVFRAFFFVLFMNVIFSIVANTFTASRANEERINIFWMATYWLYYFYTWYCILCVKLILVAVGDAEASARDGLVEYSRKIQSTFDWAILRKREQKCGKMK